MKSLQVRVPNSYPIGREALVKVGNMLLGAHVIDKYPHSKKAKRVRVDTGERAGEVLMPGQYQIMEFV